MDDIKAGVYQHFKGAFYLVLGLARHSETEERLVVYVPLAPKEGPRITVRPAEMFFEDVTRNGETRPRFKYIGSELPTGFNENNETKSTPL